MRRASFTHGLLLLLVTVVHLPVKSNPIPLRTNKDPGLNWRFKRDTGLTSLGKAERIVRFFPVRADILRAQRMTQSVLDLDSREFHNLVNKLGSQVSDESSSKEDSESSEELLSQDFDYNAFDDGLGDDYLEGIAPIRREPQPTVHQEPQFIPTIVAPSVSEVLSAKASAQPQDDSLAPLNNQKIQDDFYYYYSDEDYRDESDEKVPSKEKDASEEKLSAKKPEQGSQGKQTQDSGERFLESIINDVADFALLQQLHQLVVHRANSVEDAPPSPPTQDDSSLTDSDTQFSDGAKDGDGAGTTNTGDDIDGHENQKQGASEQGERTKEESAQGESEKQKSEQEENEKDKREPGESAKEESAQGESAKEENAQGESAKEESAQGESAKEESSKTQESKLTEEKDYDIELDPSRDYIEGDPDDEYYYFYEEYDIPEDNSTGEDGDHKISEKSENWDSNKKSLEKRDNSKHHHHLDVHDSKNSDDSKKSDNSKKSDDSKNSDDSKKSDDKAASESEDSGSGSNQDLDDQTASSSEGSGEDFSEGDSTLVRSRSGSSSSSSESNSEANSSSQSNSDENSSSESDSDENDSKDGSSSSESSSDENQSNEDSSEDGTGSSESDSDENGSKDGSSSSESSSDENQLNEDSSEDGSSSNESSSDGSKEESPEDEAESENSSSGDEDDVSPSLSSSIEGDVTSSASTDEVQSSGKGLGNDDSQDEGVSDNERDSQEDGSDSEDDGSQEDESDSQEDIDSQEGDSESQQDHGGSQKDDKDSQEDDNDSQEDDGDSQEDDNSQDSQEDDGGSQEGDNDSQEDGADNEEDTDSQESDSVNAEDDKDDELGIEEGSSTDNGSPRSDGVLSAEKKEGQPDYSGEYYYYYDDDEGESSKSPTKDPNEALLDILDDDVELLKNLHKLIVKPVSKEDVKAGPDENERARRQEDLSASSAGTPAEVIRSLDDVDLLKMLHQQIVNAPETSSVEAALDNLPDDPVLLQKIMSHIKKPPTSRELQQRSGLASSSEIESTLAQIPDDMLENLHGLLVTPSVKTIQNPQDDGSSIDAAILANLPDDLDQLLLIHQNLLGGNQDLNEKDDEFRTRNNSEDEAGPVTSEEEKEDLVDDESDVVKDIAEVTTNGNDDVDSVIPVSSIIVSPEIPDAVKDSAVFIKVDLKDIFAEILEKLDQ